MRDPTHQQLLGYLLGALEDEEQECFDRRFERDEEFRRKLGLWRRCLTPLEALRPDFEPPPGLAERTCQLVAACAPTPVEEETPWRGMSPDPALPGRAAHASWFDVAAVILVLLTTGVLILSAISNSRLRAGVASCQDHLRQFGQALTQYSHQQDNSITQLSSDGKLNLAGIVAAEKIKNGFASDTGQALCPDSWLAVQNALCYSPPQAPTDVPNNPPSCDKRGSPIFADMKNETVPPSAFLVDAPLADLSAQAAHDTHGGQGRNVFFQDGHVGFLPCSMTRDTSEAFLSRAEVSSAYRLTPAP